MCKKIKRKDKNDRANDGGEKKKAINKGCLPKPDSVYMDYRMHRICVRFSSIHNTHTYSFFIYSRIFSGRTFIRVFNPRVCLVIVFSFSLFNTLVKFTVEYSICTSTIDAIDNILFSVL